MPTVTHCGGHKKPNDRECSPDMDCNCPCKSCIVAARYDLLDKVRGEIASAVAAAKSKA